MGGRSKTLHQSAMTEDPEGSFSTLNLQCRSILVSERILSRRVRSASNLDSNSVANLLNQEQILIVLHPQKGLHCRLNKVLYGETLPGGPNPYNFI